MPQFCVSMVRTSIGVHAEYLDTVESNEFSRGDRDYDRTAREINIGVSSMRCFAVLTGSYLSP